MFSYSNENPYRIILDNDIVEDLTLFNVSSQISIESLKEIEIISNIETTADSKKISFFLTYQKILLFGLIVLNYFRLIKN